MKKWIDRYVAVRKDNYDGHEFWDFSTISTTLEGPKLYADLNDKGNPSWSLGNPYQRTVKIYISENHPYFK